MREWKNRNENSKGKSKERMVKENNAYLIEKNHFYNKT